MGSGIPISKLKGKVNPMARKGFSNSRLAKPVNQRSLIHDLATRIQEHIHFPIPDPLYISLGVLAANMTKGKPLWLMLIGVPSSGRTLILETLVDLPKVHVIGAVKSVSGLLSASSKKDTGKGSTGGVLRQIGERGLMIMKDFTSMLTIDRNASGEVISAFREVYDGRWSREVGVDGGRQIGWRGRIGFLGACTPAIDKHASVNAELGERWIYYRYHESDGFGESNKALATKDADYAMGEMRAAVGSFVDAMGLEWDGVEPRELEIRENNRIIAIAQLTAASRSSVSRDNYTKEINDIVQKEAPTRLAVALAQLYRGLELIGLDEGERWRLVCKVALDSTSQLRLRVIQECAGASLSAGGEVDYQSFLPRELSLKLKCSVRTVKMVCEDLQVLGVVRIVGYGEGRGIAVDGGEGSRRDAGRVCLTEWAKGLIEVGWKGVRDDVQ